MGMECWAVAVGTRCGFDDALIGEFHGLHGDWCCSAPVGARSLRMAVSCLPSLHPVDGVLLPR